MDLSTHRTICPVCFFFKIPVDKFPPHHYNIPKAMTERDGIRRLQRAGGWCEPVARGSMSYGS